MQEILQNADDAEATEVKFFIDKRSHGQQNLLHHGLAKFQGPALLAYNNAVFTKFHVTGKQKVLCVYIQYCCLHYLICCDK